MAEVSNSLNWFIANSQVVTGTVSVSGTTATLINLSGWADFDQSNVSLTRASTGNYTIAVTNFATGPNSVCVADAVVAATTGLGYIVTPQTATTSGTTASFGFLTSLATVAADCPFNFTLRAY